MAEQNKTGERHYGIDLLRMLSMYFVLVLHIQLQGGILENSSGTVYYMAQVLEHLALVAVNCFALISGYVGLYSSPKLSRLLLMWVQAFVYGVVFLVVCRVVHFGDADTTAHLLLPVTQGDHWYLTAYFGLWFFVPALNLAVQKFSLRQYLSASAGMFVIFSLLPTMTAGDDSTLANHGYQTIWLAVLYWLGAGLRKYVAVPQNKRGWCLGIYFFCGIFCVVRSLGSGVFSMEYNDALNLLESLALFLFFTGVRVKNEHLCSIIRKIVPALFAVYLLHTYAPAWSWLHDRFASYGTMNPLLYYPAVLGTAAVFFVLSIMIDLVRLAAERKLRVKEHLDRVIQQATEELAAWTAKKNIPLE